MHFKCYFSELIALEQTSIMRVLQSFAQYLAELTEAVYIVLLKDTID